MNDRIVAYCGLVCSDCPLVKVDEIEELSPFPIDKSDFGNMDDWLPVGNIKDAVISI